MGKFARIACGIVLALSLGGCLVASPEDVSSDLSEIQPLKAGIYKADEKDVPWVMRLERVEGHYAMTLLKGDKADPSDVVRTFSLLDGRYALVQVTERNKETFDYFYARAIGDSAFSVYLLDKDIVAGMPDNLKKLAVFNGGDFRMNDPAHDTLFFLREVARNEYFRKRFTFRRQPD